jgi:hypothetical protein
VTVWFAMVNVPERAAPGLAAALIDTVPLPVPLAPDVTDNHEVLLVAVHVQPEPVVTVTGPTAPPPAATDRVVELKE